ncbi:Inositol phosphatase/fructose-16-bisphosphatase [Methylocella silvestris BL2]|uniref:Fructose-1,6-bisphosphatase class 1 n=1 Tax=Methylocella silvestris (strain DSM 15510 / CIP 108128 / LMG 27833 / NCIMB 13906 / BL2) TaxID=395965 RepID=B8EPF5_METSB|nr:class 1 fructose-bisphosphatase [Methylocella silvestris]ACK50160.1 Inositol phosphatase/fructose-16-bisphosphatase [Methylocella silvestris BL2]
MPRISGAEELKAYLGRVVGADARLEAAAATLGEIAAASVKMSDLIGLGRLYGHLGDSRGSTNSDGDVQKELDVLADEMFVEALRRAPVYGVVSEELKEALLLNPNAPIVVSMDPLDGSSNIDANVSIGTIFSLLPTLPEARSLEAHFLQKGRAQIAAGFVIYGPQTSMVFAIGASPVEIFTLDRNDGQFYHAATVGPIPKESSEYAVNSSNYRHWEPSIRAFIEDCARGLDGPMKRNYNMRWVASLVAEAYRILLRGGIFLYPGDQRPGYSDGRLRLLYEGAPVAFLIERAGGVATDGLSPLLDIEPTAIHQRAPLVFGSADPVRLVARYRSDPKVSAERAPLFGGRGLMRD